MDVEPERPEDGLLYHYCDASAFESIIRTNKLWFSPFRHSNDSEEGIRAEKKLVQLARDYGLSGDEADELREALQVLSVVFYDCYGLCLSGRGDLLSQWRGYAADGAGFSIGFRPSALRALPPFTANEMPASQVRGPVLHEVIYDEGKQLEELTPWFESMKDHVRDSYPSPFGQRDSGELNPVVLRKYLQARNNLQMALTEHWDRLYRVKSSDFSEEDEWRLVVAASHQGEVPFKYRVSRGLVIPYLEYELPDRKKILSPIAHVYLGPKNRTPRYIVGMMLSQAGLHDVTVSDSQVSYR